MLSIDFTLITECGFEFVSNWVCAIQYSLLSFVTILLIMVNMFYSVISASSCFSMILILFTLITCVDSDKYVNKPQNSIVKKCGHDV